MTRACLVVSLLFLSACGTTSTHGSHLRQAARPAPAPVVSPPAHTPGFYPGTPAEPVYTPPGTGLPTPGQPGYKANPVPRSPNKRVLPATNEPGVWAADGAPMASADKMPAIFDIALDYPDEATPSTRKWSTFCASTMGDTSKSTGTDALFAPVHPQLRRCLASRAYLACAFDIAEHGALDAHTAKAMEAHGRALVAFNCREGQGDPKNEQPYRDMIGQWRKDLPRRLPPATKP